MRVSSRNVHGACCLAGGRRSDLLSGGSRKHSHRRKTRKPKLNHERICPTSNSVNCILSCLSDKPTRLPDWQGLKIRPVRTSSQQKSLIYHVKKIEKFAMCKMKID